MALSPKARCELADQADKKTIGKLLDGGRSADSVIVMFEDIIRKKRWRASEKAMTIAHWREIVAAVVVERAARPGEPGAA